MWTFEKSRSWSYQTFILWKCIIFLLFAVKLECLEHMKKCIYYEMKWLSVTEEIGNWRKKKFGRIDSGCMFFADINFTIYFTQKYKLFLIFILFHYFVRDFLVAYGNFFFSVYRSVVNFKSKYGPNFECSRDTIGF